MAETQYAYFSCELGLFRVKIPKFDSPQKDIYKPLKYEFEIEPVFYSPSNCLPFKMGLFSHDHKIYMVGGREGNTIEYNKRMYMFDPSGFKKFPVVDLNCIDRLELCNKFEPMVAPHVIEANDKIYFLSSVFNYDGGRRVVRDLCFQSFDPTKNCFETHPSPPLPSDSVAPFGFEISPFFLRGYIYVFLLNIKDFTEYAFTFNTISSQWKERKSLMHRFFERNIPIPLSHSGDVALSNKFSDNTWILVTLFTGIPTAYRVSHCDRGCFRPKSHRVLHESYIPKYLVPETNVWTHLVNIGDGRFCVIYTTTDAELIMYVFAIDFALEHAIQTSATSVKWSSVILCSKKFQFQDPMCFFKTCKVSGFCFVSAPSNENQDKGIIICGTREEVGGGNNSNNKKRKSCHSSSDEDFMELEEKNSTSVCSPLE